MLRKHFLMLFLLLSSFASASNLVPIERFAEDAVYSDMKISPSGRYIAITYKISEKNQTNLAILERESKKPLQEFEFGEDRHVFGFEWLTDERVGMFVQKRIGWLDGTNPQTQYAAANVDGSNRKILWDFQRSSIQVLSRLPNEPKHILLAKRHWSDEGALSLVKMNIENADLQNVLGLPESAVHSKPGVTGVGVDATGELVFAFEYDRGDDEIDPNDDKRFFHFKAKNNEWKRVTLEGDRRYPNVDFLGVSSDKQKYYFSSNHDTTESDTQALFEYDVKTEKVKLLFRHPDVDITNGSTANGTGVLYSRTINDEKGALLGVTYEAGYPESFYINDASEHAATKMYSGVMAAFRGMFASVRSMTEDGNLWLIKAYSGKNPGEFYLFDKKAAKLEFFAAQMPDIPVKQMARVEPFAIEARDGLKVYGQLTVPNVEKESNLPLVVYPHGGPYGVQDYWGWDDRAQLMASRGYLVMQLNFRGSGGYGRAFRQKGFGEWGRKMQDDLTDATKWAIATGIADKNRICIHGVSYGGYASLNAVVREPDLYQCSIPDAGTYELEYQWDNADSFVGNPERKEWYLKRSLGSLDNIKERSPVYHLDKLKADLFIVHGTEDVRVPIGNAYILEEKLKEQGIEYKTMYREDGHGFRNPKYRIELYEEMLEFLDEHIGE